MALESLPPAAVMSFRYTIAGLLLLGFALVSKASLPSGRELAFTALFGVIIIGLGTGCLAFAEVWIPSGTASLFITTSPFWMIAMEALIPGGERLHPPTILGMLVGFAGTLLLVLPSAIREGFSGPMVRGFLLLQFGCAGWSFGSILYRRQATKAHPIVSGAVQQLATGLAFLGPWLLGKHAPIVWTPRAGGALVYLIIFGSIVGYSSYIYALSQLPVSIVSIYNYINPIVALFLGWLIYSEPIGVRELVAMLIIFAGVTLVRLYGGKRAATPARPLSPEPLRTSADS